MLRLLRSLIPASALAMFLCEAILIAGSYLLAVFLVHDPGATTFLTDNFGWQLIAIITGLILFGMYFRHLYAELRVRSRILLLQQLVLVMGGAFIIEALISYLNLGWVLPRSILLPGSAIALLAVYIWRILFSAAIRTRLGLRRVLFVGFPPVAGELADYFDRHPEAGFMALGYLESSQSRSHTGLDRVGSTAELVQVVESKRPDWIVIGDKREIARSQLDEIIELRFSGVQVEDLGDFCETATGRIRPVGAGAPEMLRSENVHPNERNFRLQSVYSILFALLALPIVIPMLLAIALAVLISTGRPLFISEQRWGVAGASFTLSRFRLQSTGWFAGLGFDRLPQIWNVLRGEMAIVGPDPDRPVFARRLQSILPFYSSRLLVRPGIIGWAQLRAFADPYGPNVIRRQEYDLYYVKNLSPLLDLFIMLRWFRVLFVRERDQE